MGMFDSVMVPCPECGQRIQAQTKSGDCILAFYDFPEPGAAHPAPNDVMYDVNRHAPYTCPDCNTIFGVFEHTTTTWTVGKLRNETKCRFEQFAHDIAEGDCTYGDNCPRFGSRHGQCDSCKAREVLGFKTAQEYFESKDN
jgi:hypothetical protein